MAQPRSDRLITALDIGSWKVSALIAERGDNGELTVLGTGEPRTVKAVELSGVAGLLFRRNSLTGAVEVLQRDGTGVTLNTALHA